MTRLGYGTDDLASRSRRRRLFTVGEANRALLLVKRIVVDIVVGYARLNDLQETLEAAADTQSRLSEPIRQEVLGTIERLQRCTEELDEVGVNLVDWSRGIVDFPSKADGREVCLCWEHGQGKVTQWHEVEAGLAGRQSLETLPQGEGFELEHFIA
jgi:hypothetical protein